MQTSHPALPVEVETVAELRALYRAAEARAARLRLLSTNGRLLALAEAATLEAILQDCASRLAYFLGRRHGRISRDPAETGLPIPAPGHDGRQAGTLVIDGLDGLHDIADSEDAEACRLQLEMFGATIDRIDRERELKDRELRLEWVVGRLFSAQEEERRRVSHELHDGVAQTATGLARLLEAPDAPLDQAKLAGIARDLVGELRAVIGGLRPTVLDDLGLEAGILSLADTLEAEGYDVRLAITSDVRRWPRHFETALYRVAQEALANVRKHAGGPCRIDIQLSAAQGASGFLRIADHGGGAVGAADESRPHFGIDVMRERMASIGGSLDWSAPRGGGVIVVATFPQAF